MQLFVYGTLMASHMVRSLLGHDCPSEPFTVTGFRKLQPEACPYPYAVADPAARIEGRLLYELTAADLSRLDEYEDVAHGLYVRHALDPETWMYLAGPKLLNRDAAR